MVKQGCVLPSATSSSTAPLTWDRHQRLWPSPSPGTEDKFRLYVQHEDHIKNPYLCPPPQMCPELPHL